MHKYLDTDQKPRTRRCGDTDHREEEYSATNCSPLHGFLDYFVDRNRPHVGIRMGINHITSHHSSWYFATQKITKSMKTTPQVTVLSILYWSAMRELKLMKTTTDHGMVAYHLAAKVQTSWPLGFKTLPVHVLFVPWCENCSVLLASIGHDVWRQPLLSNFSFESWNNKNIIQDRWMHNTANSTYCEEYLGTCASLLLLCD